jgi:hypothetical protein
MIKDHHNQTPNRIKNMITLSVDVTMLDKSRLKEITRKNGKKAVFCELVMFEHANDRGDDYLVKQQVTKEERAARKEMPILGNGRRWDRGGGGAPSSQAPAPQPESQPEPPGDGVPF